MTSLSNAQFLSSNLTVMGVAALSNATTVYGVASFSNAAFLSSNLTVMGVTALSNATTVYGRLSASNAVFASSNMTVRSGLSIGPLAHDNSYPLWVQTVNGANISLYTAGDIASFSDARFKTDVRPIEGALAKVAAIGGYTFARVHDGDGDGDDGMPKRRRMAGVLAHELASVLPEVVSADAAGIMHVSYGNISALLIEATKELAAAPRACAFRVVTDTPDETFEMPLPAPPAGHRWASAVISPEKGYGRSCAHVLRCSDASSIVGGCCELPGAYAVHVLTTTPHAQNSTWGYSRRPN